MRRLLLISLATFPLAGCQFFNRDGSTVVDVIESVESGEALEAIPNRINGMTKAEEDAEAFDEPIVTGENAGVVTADLIKSTDPEARIKAATLSRSDPFATLVPVAGDPIIVTPLADSDSPRVVRSNVGGNVASSAANNSTANATNVTSVAPEPPAPTPPPVRVQPPNEPLVVPSPIATLPTIPQPVIAPTVSVSGVIQLGNEPYAIVRSGNEPERYVRVGDRIAGGSVRVKRIETLAFEPRVILEENGIEVPRPVVGGGDSAEEPEGTPVAAIPVSVPEALIPSASGTLPIAALSNQLPTPAQLSIPSSDVIPANPTEPSNSRPAAGNVPESLLLRPADADLQAVLPVIFSRFS